MTINDVRVVTVNTQNRVFDAIEALVDAGLFRCRSDLIREAVRAFIAREVEFARRIDDVIQDTGPVSQP